MKKMKLHQTWWQECSQHIPKENQKERQLTIIPRARMDSESAEWAIDSEAMRARGIIVLVKSNQLVKNIETKQLKPWTKVLGHFCVSGAFFNSHRSSPSPHPTNNVGRVYPEFVPRFNFVQGGGRENCKKISNLRMHCFKVARSYLFPMPLGDNSYYLHIEIYLLP